MTLALRDRLIPWYIVIFFAVIAIVDGVMVTLAVRTQTGMVTDHPYEKGLAYNEVIKESELQENLGWHGELSYNNTGDNRGIISFKLNDADKKAVIPDRVSVTVTRPIKAGMDFNISLQRTDTDIFRSEVIFPEKGLWELRIYAEAQNKSYQQSKRVNVE